MLDDHLQDYRQSALGLDSEVLHGYLKFFDSVHNLSAGEENTLRLDLRVIH